MGGAGGHRPDWRALLADWQLWMSSTHSEATIKQRGEVIALFARRAQCDPADCTWQDAARFLDWKPTKPAGWALGDPLPTKAGAGTRHNYDAILRAWFVWLNRVPKLGIADPMADLPVPKAPRGKPRPIATSDLARLLSSGLYRNTRTMILLGALHGMRAMEIAGTAGEQFYDGHHTFVGKGGIERTIPIHPAIADLARQYPARGHWFPSPYRPGETVTRQSVSGGIGKAMHRAGIPGGAHRLRHWYGTWALDASGNARVVQELLGHAEASSTQIYTLVQDHQLRAAVEALPLPMYVPRSRTA